MPAPTIKFWINLLTKELSKAQAAQPKTKLYSLEAAAKAIGVATPRLRMAVRHGRVFPPHVVVVKRRLYTEHDLKPLRSYFAKKPVHKAAVAAKRRAEGYFSTADVARAAAVSQFVLTYHLGRKHFGRPTHTYPGYAKTCRFYRRAEALKVAKWLDENASPARGCHQKYPKKRCPLG